MLTCQFCGLTDTYDDGYFQLDKHNRGFWCEECDGFTYFDETDNKHRFLLILENKTTEKANRISANVKFNKRLSPFRYPGGKSKIIDYLYLPKVSKKAPAFRRGVWSLRKQNNLPLATTVDAKKYLDEI